MLIPPPSRVCVIPPPVSVSHVRSPPASPPAFAPGQVQTTAQKRRAVSGCRLGTDEPGQCSMSHTDRWHPRAVVLVGVPSGMFTDGSMQPLQSPSASPPSSLIVTGIVTRVVIAHVNPGQFLTEFPGRPWSARSSSGAACPSPSLGPAFEHRHRLGSPTPRPCLRRRCGRRKSGRGAPPITARAPLPHARSSLSVDCPAST